MMKKKKMMVEIQSRYGQHTIIIDPDPEGGFVVTSSQYPELITWGKNIAHAKAMARDALELCIECLVEERMKAAQHKTVRRQKVASIS